MSSEERAGSLERLVDGATAQSSRLATKQVARIRSRYPDAAPSSVIRILERRYAASSLAAGGAVGAAAAVTGPRSGAALALTAGQAGAFIGSSATLALAVAQVHGVELDADRRRTLVLGTLIGERGSVLLERELGLGPVFWARSLLLRLPRSTVNRVNRALVRAGAGTASAGSTGAMAGRLTPFGIGALIGAATGRAASRTVVRGVARAFGPAPTEYGDAAARAAGGELQGDTS